MTDRSAALPSRSSDLTVGLSARELDLAVICVNRYIHDLRVACEQDQGTADGEPGTVGHDLQRDLRDLRRALGGS